MDDIQTSRASTEQLQNFQFEEALGKIWLSGFDDPPEYFRFFYQNNVLTRRAEVFYASSEEKIIGAAYLLHAGVRFPEGNMQKQAYYGYAFAILPEYRGNGIYGKIAAVFSQFAKAQQAGILICPENEKLLQYYIANGAVRNYRTQKAVLEEAAFQQMMRAANDCVDILPENARLYWELRNAAFQKQEYLYWNQDAVRYALQENANCGGFCKMLQFGGTRHLLFGRKTSDGKIELQETTLSAGFLRANGAYCSEKPLVTYHIPPAPTGYAGLLLD